MSSEAPRLHPDARRGLFVTGTGTGVGKSVLAAAICAALTARGERVVASKPILTGLDEPPGPFGYDHELLAAAAGSGRSPEQVSPWRFGPVTSPHLAAALAGVSLDAAAIVEAARGAAADGEVLVCEGVGGLLVPLAEGLDVRTLAQALGLAVVIAASPGLGTINHTLLTLEAARSGGLRVAGVVMTPWPHTPSELEESNRESVERLGGVPVSGLSAVAAPAELGAAGAALPLGRWVAA